MDEPRTVISVDMGRLDRVLSIDPVARLAEIQAGAAGPRIEEQLNAAGWTLGHFPDSFTHSTLGGWIATRSSGMQSDKYGDIAELTRGLRVVAPSGTLVVRPLPSTSTGPSVREMILGSRGTAGADQHGDRAGAPAAGAAGDPRLPVPDLGRGDGRDARHRGERGAAVGHARLGRRGDRVLVRDAQAPDGGRQAAVEGADDVPRAPQGLRRVGDVPRVHRLRGQRAARAGAAPPRRADHGAPRRDLHRDRPGRAVRPEEVRHPVHPRLPARPRRARRRVRDGGAVEPPGRRLRGGDGRGARRVPLARRAPAT